MFYLESLLEWEVVEILRSEMSETLICIDMEPKYLDLGHKSSEIFQKLVIQFAIKRIYYFWFEYFDFHEI